MIQVTAITAAYNAASYIENCIQSVLAPVSYTHLDVYKRQAIVRSITPYVRIILGTKTRYSGA